MNYGFKDAFSLEKLWFADSYLAIDQGPIIIGIENYRSGLLWSLFMQCPEVKNGLTKLDFTSPNI
ncbi:glucoamylase family protein [Sphingobacterium sp. T2]|uniref:glucoamylase family protein n=1 Tax=Sphingobacterium sp. T2 TaxID=1590596 RepID=UPI000ADE6C8A|nr:glucoamylase family protein [Sphingobacterium sp. T2]